MRYIEPSGLNRTFMELKSRKKALIIISAWSLNRTFMELKYEIKYDPFPFVLYHVLSYSWNPLIQVPCQAVRTKYSIGSVERTAERILIKYMRVCLHGTN